MKQESKIPIIILHGWGLKGSTYSMTAQLFEKKGYRVFLPDLPGFGSEPLISSSMDLSDYVTFLKKFVEKKKIAKFFLIGHSFGGRIALKYTALHEDSVSKVILTGVPIVRHLTWKKWIVYYLAFFGGAVFKMFPLAVKRFLQKILYFMIGEWDYYNAGPRKEVFKKIISEDLVQYAKKISIPVLLLWGKNDKLTPASDVAVIKKIIPQAQSVIVSNIGHKLPYENPEIFVKDVLSFII